MFKLMLFYHLVTKHIVLCLFPEFKNVSFSYNSNRTGGEWSSEK